MEHVPWPPQLPGQPSRVQCLPFQPFVQRQVPLLHIPVTWRGITHLSRVSCCHTHRVESTWGHKSAPRTCLHTSHCHTHIAPPRSFRAHHTPGHKALQIILIISRDHDTLMTHLCCMTRPCSPGHTGTCHSPCPRSRGRCSQADSASPSCLLRRRSLPSSPSCRCSPRTRRPRVCCREDPHNPLKQAMLVHPEKEKCLPIFYLFSMLNWGYSFLCLSFFL